MCGADVRYVFDTLHTAAKPITGEAEMAAARTMNAMWRAFAISGNPTAAGQTPWPAYDGRTIMEFTRAGPKVHIDPREGRIPAPRTACR